MSGSVAARLGNSDFMDGVAFVCSELSPLATVALMKNNDPFASRLTPSFCTQRREHITQQHYT
eukprot:5257074-Prymnesium_polylepis.1